MKEPKYKIGDEVLVYARGLLVKKTVQQIGIGIDKYSTTIKYYVGRESMPISESECFTSMEEFIEYNRECAKQDEEIKNHKQ